MLRLGAHESIAGGLHRAIERGVSAGCESLQVWTKNSRQWAAPSLDAIAVQQFCEVRRNADIHPIVAHASYLINIASSDPDLHDRSTGSLITEVERCEKLGIRYLVLHPGAHTGAGVEAGIAQATSALSTMLEATSGYRVKVLLETTAGQGTALGFDFENLARLLAGTQHGEALGVCLDTCHVFAAGYNLTEADEYEATIESFDHLIGLERLHVVHLNDSLYPLGSHKDRHEHIGEGYLGLDGFALLLNDARLDGRPGILETPKSDDLHEDRENLSRLRSLYLDT
ncbi:MAG: deoxyribonuclease IV [Anaerolineae bacterium]